jgi:hypothetical protein
LPFVGDQRRELTAERAQLAAEALKLVVLCCQDVQQRVCQSNGAFHLDSAWHHGWETAEALAATKATTR